MRTTRNPRSFRFQKGIVIDDRLAVVYNRKDYMCAMETAEIESRTMLRLRRFYGCLSVHVEPVDLCVKIMAGIRTGRDIRSNCCLVHVGLRSTMVNLRINWTLSNSLKVSANRHSDCTG